MPISLTIFYFNASKQIHTGEKRYACHICNKRVRYIKTFVPFSSNFSILTSKLCLQFSLRDKFVWKSSLNFHSRTAHKELNSTPPATVNEESDLTSLVPTTVSSNTPSTPPSGTENGYSTFSSQETSGSTSRDFSETADQIESPLVVKREPELIQTHTNKWPTGNENDLERYFQDPGTVPPTSDSQTRMDEQYALNRSQREFEVDTYVSSPLLPFSSLLTPLEDFHLL